MMQVLHNRQRWVWATLAVVVMAAIVAGGVTLAGASEPPSPNLQAQSANPTPPPFTPAPPPDYHPQEKQSPPITVEEMLKRRAETLRESEENGGFGWSTSGPETKGATIHVTGKEIQLPQDAYVEHWIGRIDCYPGVSCPKPPVYVIARGDSEIWLSGPTGEIFYRQMAPGEEGAFDFLTEALK